MCRNTARQFFRREDEIGFSIVYRQPITPEEISLAEEARLGCPTESIGNDGIAAAQEIPSALRGK
jgi:ferredoxin